MCVLATNRVKTTGVGWSPPIAALKPYGKSPLQRQQSVGAAGRTASPAAKLSAVGGRALRQRPHAWWAA